MRSPFQLLALFVLAAACGSSPPAAGPDSGEPADGGDAGPSDAGPVDAGPGDGGPADADGGNPDAGAADAGSPDAGATLAGVLLGGTGPTPGPIAGVRYECGALTGLTDASGGFQYTAGGRVAFFVSDVTLGTVAGAPQVSPWQLAGPDCASGAALDKVLVFLLSLDADGDPANGTQLTPFPAQSPRRDLSAMTLAEVAARIGELIAGRAALTVAQARDRFVRQVDDEAWTELGHDTFTGTDALHRVQGVATDGTSWYFSGTYTVEKTDAQFHSLKTSTIPAAQYLADKSNHIGDIDVYAGNVYAPLEDGSAYQHPRVMLVDTANLDFGAKFTIPLSLQTQGVPWIAVDPARGFAYLAEWNPTTQLNRFTLSTMTWVDSLPLTMPEGRALGRIQGAKVFEGALYLSTDDAGKTIYKLDLETGTVLPLFGLTGIGEEEGLAIWARPDGSLLHTINVASNSTSTELRHHARTRLPLRRQLCP